MTIKVEAWQSAGIKEDHCVEEFEFCCWQNLYDWLSGYTSLNKCPECQKTRICSQCRHIIRKQEDGLTNLKCNHSQGMLFGYSKKWGSWIGNGHEEPKCKAYEPREKETVK